MQNNRGNQLEDATQLSCSSDLELITDDTDLAALAAQLEATVPDDIVNLEFRNSLLSKLMDIQEEEIQKQ